MNPFYLTRKFIVIFVGFILPTLTMAQIPNAYRYEIDPELERAINRIDTINSDREVLESLAKIQGNHDIAIQTLLASISTINLPEHRSSILSTIFKLPLTEEGFTILHIPLLTQLYIKSSQNPISDFILIQSRSFISDPILQSRLLDIIASLLNVEYFRLELPAKEPLARLQNLLETASNSEKLSVDVQTMIEDSVLDVQNAINLAHSDIHAENSPEETSRLLADAMDRRSPKDVRIHAMTLIKSGKSDIIITHLLDPSDLVKQGLVAALADTEQNQAIIPLTDLYERILNTAVLGGTEAQNLREETIQVTEQSLVRLTGISLDPKWTPDQKLAAFRKKSAEPDTHRTPEQIGTPDEAESKPNSQSAANTPTKETLSEKSKGNPPISNKIIISFASLIILIPFIFLKKRK